jgi:TonB family protein
MRLLAESTSLLLILAVSSAGSVSRTQPNALDGFGAQKKRSVRKSRNTATQIERINGRPVINSNQVLNGKALALPRPEYPPEAKALGVYGKVKVEILIGGLGELISAKAVAGPKLLRRAAEDAARRARFGAAMHGHFPELIVRGFLVYKFPPKTKD